MHYLEQVVCIVWLEDWIDHVDRLDASAADQLQLGTGELVLAEEERDLPWLSCGVKNVEVELDVLLHDVLKWLLADFKLLYNTNYVKTQN